MRRSIVATIIVAMVWLQPVTAAGYLNIRDVRRWGQWQAQISKVRFTSTIDGLFARNEMILSIKDTLSSSYSDSMEATLSFTLPKDAVVDSMYLWISGVAEPAYLKSAWNARMIYEGIVKRRTDPALLNKSGTTDTYTMQIFPFKHREERTVRVCYTTLLNPVGDMLSHSIPMDILSASWCPAREMYIETQVRGAEKADITVVHNNQGAVDMAEVRQGTRVRVTDRNRVWNTPVQVLIRNRQYTTTGCLVNFSWDAGGETFFSAVLRPEKMFKIEQESRRKILILWNNVMATYTYNYSTGLYTPRYQYAYTNAGALNQDRDDIVNFIRTTCLPGDQINCIMNNDRITRFRSGLVPYTAATCDELTNYIDSTLPVVTMNSPGCTSPLELLVTGAASLKGQDSVVIVIIDKQSHYTLASADTSESARQTRTFIGSLPAVKSLFWIVLSTGKNEITNAYQTIQKATPGTVIPTNYMALSTGLQSIGPYLSEKIYPASVSFTNPERRYAYDVIGPSGNDIYTRASYVYTGKLYNTEMLMVACDGVLRGKGYQFSKIFTVKDALTAIPTVSDFWAGQKTDALLSRNYLPDADKKTALNLSLEYRILSSVTALLALEKPVAQNMHMADDKPSNTDTLFLTNPGTPGGDQTTDLENDPGSSLAAAGMSCVFVNRMLTIVIPGFSKITNSNQVSLKIFDMKGKVVADLTEMLRKGSGALTWRTGALQSGMYIIRLKSRQGTISRVIFISR